MDIDKKEGNERSEEWKNYIVYNIITELYPL